jgi:hypothetical protein
MLRPATLRALLWTGALLLFLQLAAQLIPAWFQALELGERLREEARLAAVEHQDPEQVRADVLKLLRELHVPVSAKDVDVEPIFGGYRIRAHYEVEIHLLWYRWRLVLTPTGSTDSV